MSMRRDSFPDDVRNLPIEVQVAVLYERVSTLSDEVRGTRRALWGFVFSIMGGSLLFLFALAVGWLGPRPGHTALRAVIDYSALHYFGL